MTIPSINVSEYFYELPSSRIPDVPLPKRDSSKLLVYKKASLSETDFNKVADFLPQNTVLVFNNTKVFPARLIFKKSTGASIEIFCLTMVSEPYTKAGYNYVSWECMVGNLKRWKGEVLALGKLTAKPLERRDDTSVVEFSWVGDESIFDVFEQLAELPLPPYMNRKATNDDKVRYQTVFAKYSGSVAAPTAGLHFTESVFDKLRTKGISLAELTLHVGAGTFRPIKSSNISEHVMHTEHFTVGLKLIEELLIHDYFIVSVGTTSTRVLESLYIVGRKIVNNELNPFDIEQWDGYVESEVSINQALEAIKLYMVLGGIREIAGSTRILIVPGYKFKLCKGIITNFHQPGSTLILLVAAFIGEAWKDLYQYALSHDFRFLSYGDSSLIIPD